MKPLHPPRFLPLILAAAACVLAALCLWQVLQLKSQLKDTTLSQAEQLSAMDAALQALPHQMEDALHTQSSLLANYDWHYGDLNPETGTLPVTFTAVPKEQTASVTTASTEIAAISAKARKNPCFCFLFRDSLSFVRMHMKLSTKRSMAVNT